jgi:hypothetical protein
MSCDLDHNPLIAARRITTIRSPIQIVVKPVMAFVKPTVAEFIATLTPDIRSATTFIDCKRIEGFLHKSWRE